ncbi:hypothetical protein KUTeg_023309 [Tegillarca granosa]|uniref:Protein SAAL1 n=1 Tax=Tegillarca granosa TaxID=220873 RepID=A0ABQ9E4S5_TEGGR|nr:hypothetical protein KUTeg_023309 [Tegillarca granosa]
MTYFFHAKMSKDTGYESPAYIRNPSPPPELTQNTELLEADSIGNTTFSKHWLFSTLMKLIEEVERESKTTEETEFGVDVDEELQNELCKLWDMSMNCDVVNFLNEFKAVQILIGVIGKSKAPRVTEICVGILGNMSCDKNSCLEMSKEEKLILLYTSLSNPEARSPWINAIIKSSDVLDHLKFMFQSSTNCDLLKNAAEFVDVLLDLEESLCTKWATTEFVHSLLEAIKQIGCGHSDTLEVYFHIFQLLSTSEEGIQALVDCGEELAKPLMKYLNVLCEDEIVGLEGRAQCLASALCVFNILFSSNENIANMILKDEKMIRIFLKILEPLVPWLNVLNNENNKEDKSDKNDLKNEPSCSSTNSEQNSNKDGQSSDNKTDGTENSEPKTDSSTVSKSTENSANSNSSSNNDGSRNVAGESGLSDRTLSDSDEKVRRDLTLIHNIIKGFIYDYMFSLYMIDTEEAEDEVVICKQIVSYLNDSCSRSRLSYFILTLKETPTADFNPADFLQDLAEKYHKNRLRRIIQDVEDGRHLTRSDSDQDKFKGK